MYEKITQYAGRLAGDPGTMSPMTKVDGVVHLPSYLPSESVSSFERDFCEGGFMDGEYLATLNRAGLDVSEGIGRETVASLGAPALLALLTWCVRSERFCEGALRGHAESGLLDDALAALAALDEP